jgi:hypothetical protein
MQLFDFIDSIWDDKVWKGVTNNIKKKHFFMLQRFMSIAYPKQADKMNVNGINEVAVVDLWAGYLKKKYKYKPKWFFTKVDKSEKKGDKIGKIGNKVKNFYMSEKKMSEKDFIFMTKMFPDDSLKDLKEYEKNMKMLGMDV